MIKDPCPTHKRALNISTHPPPNPRGFFWLEKMSKCVSVDIVRL